LVSSSYQLSLFISIPFGNQQSYPYQTDQPNHFTAMHTPAIPAPCAAAEPARPGLFARLAALYMKPTLRELDLATLRDIGAPEALRAQAELREAWRRWLPPTGPFRDL
jgi:hypothetical protein